MILRKLTGYGTPRGLADRLRALIEGLLEGFGSARVRCIGSKAYSPTLTPSSLRSAAA